MAMLSVAGTRRRKKSGAIIASPGEKSGLITCADMRLAQYDGVRVPSTFHESGRE